MLPSSSHVSAAALELLQLFSSRFQLKMTVSDGSAGSFGSSIATTASIIEMNSRTKTQEDHNFT